VFLTLRKKIKLEEDKERKSYGEEINNGRESFGSSGFMVI
jgi:hypothetical protein